MGPGGENAGCSDSFVSPPPSFCHPIFLSHNIPVGDKQPMILKWRILSATNDLDRVSAVALPKLPISLTNTDLKVASDTQFYPGLGMWPPAGPLGVGDQLAWGTQTLRLHMQRAVTDQ